MKRVIPTILISLTTLAFNAHAEGASHHSGQASKHSVLASTHTLASTAEVASAVVATPLIVAGGVSLVAGSVVLEAGSSVAKSHAHHGPLVITEKTVTADPAPNQVIIINNNEQKPGN